MDCCRATRWVYFSFLASFQKGAESKEIDAKSAFIDILCFKIEDNSTYSSSKYNKIRREKHLLTDYPFCPIYFDDIHCQFQQLFSLG
jgi:hypothetical protein